MPSAHFFPPLDANALADLIAAQWGALLPGPQPEQEEAALEAQRGRIARYARTFLEIAREAAQPA